MTLDYEIMEIKKTLEEHEERIKELEKLGKDEVKKVPIKRESIPDHLNYLKSEKFFDQPKFTMEIMERLAQEGYHYPLQSLTHPLQQAVRKGTLGRIKKEKKWAYCKR